MIDFQTMTDEELQDTRVAILTEVERRQRIAQIPEQVRTLAGSYVQDGGDIADLTVALTAEVQE